MTKSVLGFYLWAHSNVDSVDYILGKMRNAYPDSDLVISSDNGSDFTDIANKYNAINYIHGNISHGPCNTLNKGGRYGWTAEQANLWLTRVYEACTNITNDYVMLMEEDVLVKERFRFPVKDLIMIPNIKNGISPLGMNWVNSRGGRIDYPYYSAGGGTIINRIAFINAYHNHIDSFIENYETIYDDAMKTGYIGWGWNDSIIAVLMYANKCSISTELPIIESGNENDPAPIIHNFKKFYESSKNKEMKKIIFYHAYLDDPYKLVIQEQLTKIFTSGLYKECDKIEMRIASPKEDRTEWVLNLVKNYSKINAEVITVDRSQYPSDWREEKITMLHLKQMADEVPGYYCYIHTKGISNRKYEVELWRHSSDYATIYDWKRNINMLDDGYDAVGPNLRFDTHLGYYPHFSGTYFWTTHKYIRTLKEDWLVMKENRFLVEFWIGANPNAKLGSTFECGNDAPYLVETTINKYINHE